MSLAAEVGIARLSKFREELCGDATDIVKGISSTTVVLSDGLGSGVKANILATLTTRIASGLLKRNVAIDHVFSTIADTLPTCQVRGLAYSTLAVAQISTEGQARLFEYDSPETMIFREDKLMEIPRRPREIGGLSINELSFEVKEHDVLIMVSDGVLHAGVGALFDLGLGRSGLVDYLPPPCSSRLNAEQLANRVIHLAQACYLSKPGDDCTAVVIKIRKPQVVTVLTGPAQSQELDEKMVRDFLVVPNTARVVCGGTTAQIVSRITGKEIETSLDYLDPRVPPIAKISGVDLTTEGILTLNRCYEILRSAMEGDELPLSEDGATLLAKRLWNAEHVNFMIGRGMNPAQANLEQLVHLAPRNHVIDKLAKLLVKRNIKVQTQYY